MTCRHKYIRTWVFEDTKQPSGLWSCIDCGLKFEPITQRTWIGLTDEDIAVVLTGDASLGTRLDELTPSWIQLVKAVEAKLKEKNFS